MADNENIRGHLSVGRNVTVGGRAIVRGDAQMDHNLKVKGWLEADNIKDNNKGVYGSPSALQAAYPSPLAGWYAGVYSTEGGAHIQMYRVVDGAWQDAGCAYTINSDYPEKADKVSGATEGNFAALNDDGNLLDSGMKPSDFALDGQVVKTVQQSLSDGQKAQARENIGAASSSELEAIDNELETLDNELETLDGQVVKTVQQSLNNGQKEQARENIGAASRSELEAFMGDYRPIEIHGDVTNAADEEDLTSENVGGTEVIRFKDKSHAPDLYSGKGKKYLRKNVREIGGVRKNWLEQSMLTAENTIYIVQYDYEVSTDNDNTVTMPQGCVLKFEGGSIGGGLLVSNDTMIEGTPAIEKPVGVFYNKEGEIVDFKERYKIQGKSYIRTQKEFEAVVAAAKSGEAVDAVLGSGTFIVKECITDLDAPFKLVGTEGTVVKRDNRVFRREESDLSHNTASHLAFKLGSERVQPFSVFTDTNNDIVRVSEYAHVNYTDDYFVFKGEDGKGHIIEKDGIYSYNHYNDTYGCFYIPKGDIEIPSSQLPYVYGHLTSAYSVDRFVLTGDVEELETVYDQQTKIVTYFKAVLLPRITTSSNRNFGSNPNSNGYLQRRLFVLYNTSTDGGIYYNGTHLYVPNGVDSIEVVDGWFRYLNSEHVDYNNRPQYFVNGRTANAPIYISGITFRNFQNVFYIDECNQSSEENTIGFTIKDCVFEKCTAVAIDTRLIAPKGRYAEKDTSYIHGCKFIGCGLVGYQSVRGHATTKSMDQTGGGIVIDGVEYYYNCIGTVSTWLEISECLFDGTIEDYNPYKNGLNLLSISIDGTVKGCVFRNAARNLMAISEGMVTVEGCDLYNTDAFLSDTVRNLGFDAGLLYMNGCGNNKNYPVVIKDNRFHDNLNIGSRRLLYLDESRTDVLVQGNVLYSDKCINIDARCTDNGDLTFYAWSNESDVIYTLSKSSHNSHVYTYDSEADEFTDTGVDLEIIITKVSDNPTVREITYDGRVWTRTEDEHGSTEGDITGKNWASANVKYIGNVVAGPIRLVCGDDVQDNMLPEIKDNVFCGGYSKIVGTYTETGRGKNAYLNRDIYKDSNVDVQSSEYNVERNGIAINASIYGTLTPDIRCKVYRKSEAEESVIITSYFPKKNFYKEKSANSQRKYYHHITFTWNRDGVALLEGSYIRINFISTAGEKITYELVLERQADISKFVCYSKDYDFGRVFVWRNPDDVPGEAQHWNIAISYEDFKKSIYTNGGVFEIEAPQDVLDSITIDRKKPYEELPDNFQRTNSSNPMYVPDSRQAACIIEKRHSLGKDENDNYISQIIFNDFTGNYADPTHSDYDPFSLKRLSPEFYTGTCQINAYATNGDGIITRYGIYLVKGNTAKRPTPIYFDAGLHYHDTNRNQDIIWNGSRWIGSTGFTPAIRKGTTENRPIGQHTETQEGETVTVGDLLSSDNGYAYYDTTIGKMIYASAINTTTGVVTWVDALGNDVSTVYQAEVTGTNGNFAGFDAQGKLADSGSKPGDFQPAS